MRNEPCDQLTRATLSTPRRFLMYSTTVSSSSQSLCELVSWNAYDGGHVADRGLGISMLCWLEGTLHASSILGRGDKPDPWKSSMNTSKPPACASQSAQS